jgi:hypothetical protein
MYRSRSYRERSPEVKVPVIGCLGIIILVALLIGWAIAPALHLLFFDLLFLNPIFWVLVVLIFLSLLVSVSSKNLGISGIGLAGSVIFSILALLYMFLAGPIADEKLAKSIQPEKLEVMPDTKGIRYLPHEVAEVYAKSKMNNSAYVAGDLDPFDYNGELDYIAPRIPNGLWNSLFSRTAGVIIIKPDGSVDDSVQTPQQYGEGMYISSNILWRLFSVKYWSEIPETYYIILDGEILTISPYISYHFDFPVMVPGWGGVLVLHSDGSVEDLSPEQAIADPRFEGQRLYPEALALRIGNAWQYRGADWGIWNAVAIHHDQTELPHVKDSENQMPYLLPGDPNPFWFVGLEPHGTSYSVYKMLFTDAHTGKISLYEVPPDKNLIGPNKALDFIKAAFPDDNWYRQTGDTTAGTVVVIEPKPVIQKGILFWQASVTNLDYAGISRTVLFNTDTEEVLYFNTLDELSGFLQGTFAGRSPENQENLQPLATGTEVPGGIDLSRLSDRELLDLLQQIVDELSRRSQ